MTNRRHRAGDEHEQAGPPTAQTRSTTGPRASQAGALAPAAPTEDDRDAAAPAPPGEADTNARPGETDTSSPMQELDATTPAGDRHSKERAAALAARIMAAAGDRPQLHAALKDLSPREAAMFLEALDRSLKKRRLLLWGYALSALAMIVGLPLSLYLYGTRDPGTFGGWYFLIPFGIVGALLFGFGRLARRR